MLKIQELRELIKLVDQSSIDEFSYELDGSKIKMKKNKAVTYVEEKAAIQNSEVHKVEEAVSTPAAPAQAPKAPEAPVKEEAPAPAADENLHKIVSPMVGTFYQSPSPDAGAYVKAGSKVTDDSVVCIVEAMKLFNEIEAEVKGEIVEILVKDGQLVEYGQPLFLVKPE
ncbi:acetyl-CoA carboxylase biotin carboxyl carrier protein [Rossellomorea vietnamensis]|uniref:Biotin carboxyl carrier protein of acetyl-CoA carboxylase n=2 Tax=Rossellomorea TaxID=2837508 RepID=A0A5D4KG99_9BACI|nr:MULTISPECIES: acetyl-CoA carboxylase biotin carboxyl carrier protein [Rossellomorea]TYR76311.1 acetyl-CoA carboxylase biotin carboxyl carrier protein [Rossellomorea vietnamensis]TYS70317.1 acetyl-CoA carboxylase biotin carboxyl carrier protein [Rossellomorea aquimaris]